MAKTTPHTSPGSARYLCEAEVVTGLKNFAADELQARFGDAVTLWDKAKDEELPFGYDGALEDLAALDKSVAVYLVRHFAIPRPQALLGHQHFTQLSKLISSVRSMNPTGTFSSFRISAAGGESSVFLRIREAITEATGLDYDDDEADLLLRVRKADLHREGWEVLARLTPRPLSARAWRICNMEGALNAVIASAMIELTQPQPDDRFFNLMCGSGTLLIERLRRGPAAVAGGCDTDVFALRCATDNAATAGFRDEVDIMHMDATNLAMLPDACLDVICADLPWGSLVGSHEQNLELYPQIMAEAARVAAPAARAVFITHEIRLMERLLREHTDRWTLQQEIKVFQGGLHPRIYVLQRR